VIALAMGSGWLGAPRARAQMAPRTEATRLPLPGMKIRLRSIAPAPGQTVVRETLLRANLDYSVAGFESGEFRIITQFDTDTKEEGATEGDDVGDCVIVKPSGRCEILFPMRSVWDEKAITRPFRVWFYLVRKMDERRWEVVAWTGPTLYPAK
jgi:hypothetical protein